MTIVFVSAGLLTPKKGTADLYRRARYLNYGLLSLANSPQVLPGAVFHGHFDQPERTVARIASRFDADSVKAVLISCPSFLSVEWAAAFVKKAHDTFRNSSFVLGGRWVVDGNENTLREAFPNVDLFVEGVAEQKISAVVAAAGVDGFARDPRAEAVFAGTGLSLLDYSKLDDREKFIPSLEGSRGCGAGCAFCAEANVRLTKLKPPRILCDEWEGLRSFAPDVPTRFYLETSNFTPLRDWATALIREREAAGQQQVHWRTEARVDMFSTENVQLLSKAGLRVLDLGLESASPTQLRRMGKTRDPQSYLRRCAALIETAASCGIAVKLNVLLFPGETEETIRETVDWLADHKAHFVGVSAFPTIYYGFARSDDPQLQLYRSLGASLSDVHIGLGISGLNLSPEIDYRSSQSIARHISRAFMSANEYYRLKSFSYFDPAYSFSEFMEDARSAPHDELPFSLTGQ